MKQLTTLLVSTFVVFLFSWTANAAGIEATTDEGKRVLLNDDMTWQYIESKQDKADKELANALVKFVRMVVKEEGKQANVPFEGCYKSLVFKEVVNNPSLSEEDLMYKELITVENLNYLSGLSIEELTKGFDDLMERDQNAELTKNQKLMSLAMALSFLTMGCWELLE